MFWSTESGKTCFQPGEGDTYRYKKINNQTENPNPEYSDLNILN